jgi:hypothetical protein
MAAQEEERKRIAREAVTLLRGEGLPLTKTLKLLLVSNQIVTHPVIHREPALSQSLAKCR